MGKTKKIMAKTNRVIIIIRGGVLVDVYTQEPTEVVLYDFDSIEEGNKPTTWLTQESNLEEEIQALEEEVKEEHEKYG